MGEIREIDRSRPGKTIERRGEKKDIRRIGNKIREETNHELRAREKKRERWFGLSVWKEGGERREMDESGLGKTTEAEGRGEGKIKDGIGRERGEA